MQSQLPMPLPAMKARKPNYALIAEETLTGICTATLPLPFLPQQVRQPQA